MNVFNFFNGQVAVVTGAASGIGKAIAKQLIANGANVYALDINEEGMSTFIEDASSSVKVFKCDVTDANEVQSVIRSINKEAGRIDFLFAVAGIGYAGEMTGYSIKSWNTIIDINIRGVVNCLHVVYPIMKEQKAGRIVNVASIAGIVPSGLLVPYATTKHAVVGLSKSLRLEAELNNIMIHVVYPGVIDTKMLEASHPIDMPENSRIAVRKYLSSITGKPRSADELVTYMLSRISKNKLDIYYPTKVREILGLYRYFPNQLKKLAIKAVKKELSQKHFEK
jgi:NAD(P)-dependent dehydrogenase (short-subunit alcohol dehydrogenase family)